MRLVAAACLAAGLAIGFALPVSAIGTDGTSLDALAKAHPVDCGSAWHQTFTSITCQDALSGRKTTSLVLMILGAVVLIGTVGFVQRTTPGAGGEVADSPRVQMIGWAVACVGWAFVLAMLVVISSGQLS